MALLSRLKTPDSATMVGLATAAGVYLIYQNALPSVTDIISANPHDDSVEKARKMAAIKSAVLVGLVFVISRDVNSYIISGAALLGIDYLHKHANATDPATMKLEQSGAASIAPTSSYPLPQYEEAA
jgi:hypothetical protein